MLQWQVHPWMLTLLVLHRRSCGYHNRFCLGLLLPEMHELEHCLQLWDVTPHQASTIAAALPFPRV